MAHVFISYARKDRALLDKARTALQRARKSGWIDSDSIKVAGEYQTQIDNALRSASAVVVLLSPESASSPYVTYEWSFALGAGRPVVPVLVRRAKLHPRLSALQYLDATNRRDSSVWDRLAREIRRLSSAGATAVTGDSTPELVARLELVGGRPAKIGKSYKIILGTANVPEGTERVYYQIHDDTFTKEERRFAVPWGAKNFSETITSYGDIFLSARGKGTAAAWRTQSTLVEALRRAYGARKSKVVERAIAELENN